MKLFENKVIVTFGDSVMKGIVTDSQCTGELRYVISDKSFTSICERKLGAKINNYGRFGNTVRRGLRDIKRHIVQIEDAQYALLEFGGNDSNHDEGHHVDGLRGVGRGALPGRPCGVPKRAEHGVP